ncbi:hypothetical protein SESBI_33241, partial [Sesbania bispinosa]
MKEVKKLYIIALPMIIPDLLVYGGMEGISSQAYGAQKWVLIGQILQCTMTASPSSAAPQPHTDHQSTTLSSIHCRSAFRSDHSTDLSSASSPIYIPRLFAARGVVPVRSSSCLCSLRHRASRSGAPNCVGCRASSLSGVLPLFRISAPSCVSLILM